MSLRSIFRGRRTMNLERLWPEGPVFQEAEYLGLTTDTILLAYFARPGAGQRGADLGCASGALMLLLLWRENSLRMTGLELQEEACSSAEDNLRLNGLADRTDILCGDLRETLRQLPNGGFDFVISNPPYYERGSGALPQDIERAAARAETAMNLADLCQAASRLCRSGGKCWFCYRPERLGRLLREMSEAHLEPKRIRFVHHNALCPAFLVLVEGRKDGRPGLRVEKPFLLHDDDGQESPEYRAVCHRP